MADDVLVEDQAQPVKKKRSLGSVVPAVVVAVGLIVAAKMFTGGHSAATTQSTVAATATSVPAGPIVRLEPITLNMADGRFLRVAVALQLASGAKVPDSASNSDPGEKYAPVLDQTIHLLSGRSYEELVTAEGKEKAKADLLRSIQPRFPDVQSVLFVGLVME